MFQRMRPLMFTLWMPNPTVLSRSLRLASTGNPMLGAAPSTR